MDNIDLNKHLAEKVMDFAMSTSEERKWCGLPDWNPAERIEHAMMCLGTFGWWNCGFGDDDYSPTEYFCEVQGSQCQVEVDKSLPMAISLACAKVSGWEDG